MQGTFKFALAGLAALLLAACANSLLQRHNEGVKLAQAMLAAERPATSALSGTPVALADNAGARVIPLGEVNVSAMRALVQTMREVKVALRRPFDPGAKLVDQMVCHWSRNDIGFGMALDCGTQGWYTARRDATQLEWLTHTPSAVEHIGHPWHSVRVLNSAELPVFRALLRVLPPPGNGEVKVVNADGQTLMIVGPSGQSSETRIN